jgi:hypothetical protein
LNAPTFNSSSSLPSTLEKNSHLCYTIKAKRKVLNNLVQLDLKLPDSLAREAQAAGLLTPQAIEQLLREEIRRRVGQLFDAADRLSALDAPPLTEAEVEVEIQAAREARHSSNSPISLPLPTPARSRP